MVTKRIVKRKKANIIENPAGMTREAIQVLEQELFPVTSENMPDIVTHLDAVSGQKEILTPKQIRQREFLRAYTSNNFNISAACRSTNIGRKTYYRWKDGDPDFRDDMRSAQGELRDYLKSKLLELVDANNLIAVIFANKTLGGLVETTRQDIRVNEPLELTREHADKVVQAGLQSMLDRPKYQKMLGLEPEPEP